MGWRLSPEGAAELFKYTVGEAEFFATFGQFIYEDVNPNAASGGLGINGLSGTKREQCLSNRLAGWIQIQLQYQHFRQSGEPPCINTRECSAVRSTPAPLCRLTLAIRILAKGPLCYTPAIRQAMPDTGLPARCPVMAVQVIRSIRSAWTTCWCWNFRLNLISRSNNLAARIFGDFAYNLHGRRRAQEAASAYSYILSQTPNATVNASPFSATNRRCQSLPDRLHRWQPRHGRGLTSGAEYKEARLGIHHVLAAHGAICAGSQYH